MIPPGAASTFDEMVDSYYEQVAALVEAGVDLLLPETVIDTLNLKACLFAIDKLFPASRACAFRSWRPARSATAA